MSLPSFLKASSVSLLLLSAFGVLTARTWRIMFSLFSPPNFTVSSNLSFFAGGEFCKIRGRE